MNLMEWEVGIPGKSKVCIRLRSLSNGRTMGGPKAVEDDEGGIPDAHVFCRLPGKEDCTSW